MREEAAVMRVKIRSRGGDRGEEERWSVWEEKSKTGNKRQKEVGKDVKKVIKAGKS